VTGANSTVGADHAQEIGKIRTNQLTSDHAAPTG
jgi:hypothetical protein